MDTQKKSKSKYQNAQRIILRTLLLAGVVSIAILAPNALQVLQMFNSKNKRYRSPRYVESVIGRLIKKKLIAVRMDSGEKILEVTPLGERVLLRAGVHKIPKRKSWDGKWRIVMFDVSEKRKMTRERIREELRGFGFVRFQDSVWVFPYECNELIALLKTDVLIGRSVRYIIADYLENDALLRKHFGLPLKR